MIVDLVTTGLLHGLLLSCVAYAVSITFRILHVQDITAEGAYPMGGAVAAKMALAGYAPLLAILGGMVAGGLLGVLTSIVHVRLKIHALLAGIIVSTMAYSINLRIMRRPNIALFNFPTLFTGGDTGALLMLAIFMMGSAALLYLFLQTEYGLRLRAVGVQPYFAQRQGIIVWHYICLGMGVAGMLAGLGGGLMVHMQRYMDIGIGVGIAIHALAALMLGEVLVGSTTLRRIIIAPLVGSLVYQQLQGIVFAVGLTPSDIKLFTGIFVLGVVALRSKN